MALKNAAIALREGKILAIKGLGGFHLMADAVNPTGSATLRQRKRRPDKPFALMYPSLDLIRSHCEVTPQEAELLLSPEAPIVLLKQKSASPFLNSPIAPGNPYLGVMLPYTPLHHFLLAELNFPVVATSGNLSDEPICIDEGEVLRRLGEIADCFLVHNRPIVRPLDDSVVRIMGGREMLLRRARGYAPLPITIKGENPAILAVGGHLKNAVAISKGEQIFLSQHLGDLTTGAAFNTFKEAIISLQSLYDFQADIIACDAHPEYISHKFAQSWGLENHRGIAPTVIVQHHYAHTLACMGEQGLKPPVLGVAWDGTGYGEDGTIWGGEFLYITEANFERVAYFRPFKLPGGELAIKEPRRAALGLLAELGVNFDSIGHLASIQAFSDEELLIAKTMLFRNLNSPITSSVGRLFDAVASLLNICQKGTYEGQAAMALEFVIGEFETQAFYTFCIKQKIIDWQLILEAVIDDILHHTTIKEIAAKFHNTLIEIIINVAKKVGEPRVVLTGGCWQNRYLTERAIQRLRQEKFHPYWHQHLPPNDGGIALGQIIAARRFANYKL